MLDPAQAATAQIRLAAIEPAPLDGQPVKTDAGVKFGSEQQHQVKRPHIARPHAVGRLVGADQRRLGQHVVQVDRGHEKQGETSPYLQPPERGIAVAQAVLVLDEGAILAVAGRKLAHGQPGMADEDDENDAHHPGNQKGVGLAQEIGAFEEAGDGVKGIVADQDGGHEEHVRHQEERQKQAGGALQQVEAGRPAAFAAGLGGVRLDQTGDVDRQLPGGVRPQLFVTACLFDQSCHDAASLPTVAHEESGSLKASQAIGVGQTRLIRKRSA